MRLAKMIFQVSIVAGMILFSPSLVASQICGPPALNCSAPVPCCSNSNSCGSTTAHCGVGCLSQYSAPGACISSKALLRATTIAASNPRCGIDPTNGKSYGTCKARDYCCSFYGYCGVGDYYCIGCQKGFGRCPILCDEAKPCGAYGMSSFVLSWITLALSVIALSLTAYSICRGPPADNRHFSVFNMCNRR